MTDVVGHRGARGLWNENSLTGFRRTLALGIDAVEFDVHLTDAGELVVLHDARLERTTDGTGPVRALTPQGRRRIRVLGSDDTLPTLAEVLTVLGSAARTRLHVELKNDADGQSYPGIVGRVVDELERHGLRGRCHLSSFDVTVLTECRRVAPDIPRLVSVDAGWVARQGGVTRFLADVDDLVDVVAVHHGLLAAHWDLVVAAVPVDRLGVWTINDPLEMSAWLDRGIGFLTSDRPDLALAARVRAGNGPEKTDP